MAWGPRTAPHAPPTLLDSQAGAHLDNPARSYPPTRATTFRARVRCGASTIWPLNLNA
jgi:hypothetical protein